MKLTDKWILATSATIFSGGNRHPRAELELARAIEAEVLRINGGGMEVVAWGRRNAVDKSITDCISPAEHDRVEGDYTIPLCEAPRPQGE